VSADHADSGEKAALAIDSVSAKLEAAVRERPQRFQENQPSAITAKPLGRHHTFA
jgi:hypothetical protein